MRTRIVSLLSAVLLAAGVAAAQQMQPVIHVGDFHVKPGMEGQFMSLVKEYDQPVFRQLMAEGAVLGWGIDVPVLHHAGGATHTIWWDSPDLAAFDKVFAALQAMEKRIAEADAKATEDARKRGQPAPKSALQKFLETVDISKHQDYLLRDLLFGGGAPPADGARPYRWVSLLKVQPGKSEEFRRLWVEYDKPVYDKLVAEGVIYLYAVGVEEARSTDAFTHYVEVSIPDLAAREKIREAFRADRQARSASERSIITGSFMSVLDPSGGRDELLRAVVYEFARPK